MPVKLICFVLLILASEFPLAISAEETLPPLTEGKPPQNFEQMWAGFDPRAEPLETKILHEWKEEGVVLRIVQFRIGIFKGQQATLVGIYGFPKGGEALPGLLQIHGGGQYADHKACLQNAKRGYATLSIAWAGRISAPEYRVDPAGVKLFWKNQTDDPQYRVTTNWGAVDGYHAPGRNAGNHFPSAKPAEWTLDAIESPRNSGWFLCAVAARRSLKFLEQQPEVDPDRLGVYGHSMGGKLTVLTAVDSRVKAAAPSCGGISDRDNDSKVFRTTLGDDVSLKQISCPIVFLSPANDFHGRIGDLPRAIEEIESTEWRVTCAPHHNHQDTAPFEVATQLWFDQYLRGTFEWPLTPETELNLNADDGVTMLSVKVDSSKPVLAVDVYYTQQGKADETRFDRELTMNRFWHHASTEQVNDRWEAALPIFSTDKPLWVYANVRYSLDPPVVGAGYYYGAYTANTFNVSSLLQKVTPEELREADVKATLKRTTLIESFADDWEQEWFTYKPTEWARTTHKLFDDIYQAPAGAKLAIDVQAEEANELVILLDDHAAEVKLEGDAEWNTVVLSPVDFKSYSDAGLTSWDGVKRLTLSPAERLRPARGEAGESRIVGKNWRGTPPQFRNLCWIVEE